MRSLLYKIKCNFISCTSSLIIGGIIFLAGLIVGIALQTGSVVESNFYRFAQDYLSRVINPDYSLTSLFVTRCINAFMLYIVIFLISLNRFTIFFNFIIIFYRGYILGFVLRLTFLSLGIQGIIIFIFLALVQTIIGVLSIIIYTNNMICEYSSKSKIAIKQNLVYVMVSVIICIIGAILEFLLCYLLLRPLNLYF